MALVVAVVAQSAFVVVYGSRPWWRHRVGRALMLKSSSLLAALWLTFVDTFWVYPAEEKAGTVVLAAIAAAITYQLVALLRTPRDLDGKG